jgi:hypothetical protein
MPVDSVSGAMLDPMPAGQPALRDSFAHHHYAKSRDRLSMELRPKAPRNSPDRQT